MCQSQTGAAGARSDILLLRQKMRLFVYLIFVITVVQQTTCSDPAVEDEVIRARAYMQLLNKKLEEDANRLSVANWAYATDINDANLQNMLALTADVGKKSKEYWAETIKFSWQTFTDYDLKRQFKINAELGTSALPEEKLKALNKIVSDMEKVYSTAKICSFKNNTKCDNALEPELTEVFENSRDPEELKHVWIEWRNAVGPHVKNMYKEYVKLENEAAALNNYSNAGDYWLSKYEAKDFKEQIQSLWDQLKPFYLQIHAYIRHKLREVYGDVVKEKGPIPAHLLGNMWAQTWTNVAELALPYPGKQKIDVSEEMKKQNYTAQKMFKLAEEFFVSVNLSAMPPLFWERSVLEKPVGKELVCHASAWDFYDGKDFRIKQCTKVTEEHLNTVHHEMGHVEYFIQYKDQPYSYREGANPGFHEAVGDTIALSVQTTKHLRKIGLIQTEADDPEITLNNLFRVSLSKIAFLPFGYLMDLWRWDVFSGKITPENYNTKWWQLRQTYQGVEPPETRTENDFDPAAKYHIIANVPYIRYFVSTIIQFQFQRALCEKAGQYVPEDESKQLHNCDIYQNTVAGNALGNMLRLGASRPWPDAMEVLTGQRNMDASGLLEYFSPLQKWLEDYNRKNNVYVGWEPSDKVST